MGRNAYSTRGVVEDVEGLRITPRDLKNRGYLPNGGRGIVTHRTGGKKTGSSSIHVQMNDEGYGSVTFSYTLDEQEYEYSHGIEPVPCNYGGHRFYFRCRCCAERVYGLYLYKGFYFCRECHGLVYRVSREHRNRHYELKRSWDLRRKAERVERNGKRGYADELRDEADRLYMIGTQKTIAFLHSLATQLGAGK